MITYKFNNKIGILETVIIGDVSISDFVKYITSLIEDESLPPVLKIFTDASKGRIATDIKYEELPKIVEVNNNHLKKRELICDAFVLSSSIETALGQLYMELSNSKNYFFNIFSTKESALYWLKRF